ncbi:5-methylcytosine-specific restriction enzyme subunit McrC [Rhizobium leguminosarum]|uniref:5-methylcytosine-specific restriction enzyme subunit McrC n=1 Tax=Rhizobium leguminosarum TaxID=384 RepID=A0AAE2MM71_RHILE|nr:MULTISPECIES: hypothetical protein [Rhizobium]MBB4291439.1 5-methylcytosine-specific restriction enzyme subunit McrC [Rhizobium leguminosarum]MBB4296135.1 5-methylcytosine-specific restriction enzyme subunit McrC [Rhizobium leguminosarum]MBB4308606.1 5-methylcytosine-specific restriction enzyme subunit McrC [Rhizobium leguminosarum]MBB4416441.1 5-methylcytosine-specific restriction enzyme subunit McrC [Rhizobium leguminosarum]MBB4430592.1 5-methylcytosine-specific restriction enzyme subunit
MIRRRITVEEWEKIPLSGNGSLLSFAEVQAIFETWRIQTDSDPEGYFVLSERFLRAKNWSGILPTNDVLLEVVPRGAKNLRAEEKDVLDRNVGLMMQAALSGRLFSFSDAELSDTGDRYEALISSFVDAVSRARGSSLLRRYSTNRATTSKVIGRNVFPAQILESLRRPGYFVSEWVSLDEDIAENRFLSGVLKHVRPHSAGQLRARLDRQLVGLDNVASPADPMREWAKIRFDRVPEVYRRALQLGRAILERRAPGIFAGAQNGTSEIVFTARAFEAFMANVFDDLGRSLGFHTVVQGSYDLGAWSSGKNAFEINPDIELMPISGSSILIDTKWKRLNPHAENYGVKPEDVYQMISYATRLGHNKAILLYPWIGPNRPNRQLLKIRSGNLRLEISIATIDLLEANFRGARAYLTTLIDDLSDTRQALSPQPDFAAM